MAKTTPKVIDFSNVKDAGQFNPHQVPMGDYLAKIVKVEDGESKKSKAFQYVFTIKLVKFSSYGYPYYCVLQENQLWKLRNLLVAAGQNVPKKRIKLDPSRVVGKLIGVTMEDDEYEGKMKSVIASVFPASELGDDVVSDTPIDDEPEDDESYDDGEDEVEDTEDEDTEEDEAEDESEEEANPFAAMDRNELKVFIRSKDPKFRFLKSQTDDDLRDTAIDLAGDSSSDDELEELEIDDL